MLALADRPKHRQWIKQTERDRLTQWHPRRNQLSAIWGRCLNTGERRQAQSTRYLVAFI